MVRKKLSTVHVWLSIFVRFKRIGITSGPLVYFVRFCARHGISGGDLVVNEIQHHCFGVCTGNKILCYGFSNYSLDVRINYHVERIIIYVVLHVFICGIMCVRGLSFPKNVE